MQIEFHNPQGQVKKWVLDYVTDKLIKLHQRNKIIISAQIYYREPVAGAEGEKICEIVLASYGNPLFVHRRSESFEQASRDAIADLTERIEEKSSSGLLCCQYFLR
jgi:hypothetical protein